LGICLERLKTRCWDIPYPASSECAFELAVKTDILINNNSIQILWANIENCDIIDLECVTDDSVRNLAKNIRGVYQNETN
jgi:hypothetical protein